MYVRDSKQAWIVRTPYEGGVERLHINIYEDLAEAQAVAKALSKHRRVTNPAAKPSYVSPMIYLPVRDNLTEIGEDPAKILKDPDPADSYGGR